MTHLQSEISPPRDEIPPDWNSEERSDNVLPVLFNVYRDQGYRAGYRRGINDVLLCILESTEDFARQDPPAAVETRALLHALSERIERNLRPSSHLSGFVEDGLGI